MRPANFLFHVSASTIWSRPATRPCGSRLRLLERNNWIVETLEQIKARAEAAVPGAQITIVPNDSPSGQRSLLVDPAHGLAVAKFLRDDSQLQLDYASNVTGVDWLDVVLKEKVKVKKVIDGVEKEVEE